MSRVGRKPIEIPKGVELKLVGNQVSVKGPKGELTRSIPPELQAEIEDGHLVLSRPSDEPRLRSLHGMARALIQNMVTGVSSGYERVLEVNGVGYRAELSGQNLMLYVGFSHPVEITPPEGIKFDVDTRVRQIKVIGYDKELVGQVSANLRSIRPPEPYKGKGIKYIEEKVRRKAGKTGKG